MKVNVTLSLDGKEEEILNKVIAYNKKMGSECSQESALTSVLEVGAKWDTFLYQKMCEYLWLMGECTYEESCNMVDEYKKVLDEERKKQEEISKTFRSLPISRTDFLLSTGKFLESKVDMNYIINTWNECNTEEGKYLINTKDHGIEFGLKSHSLLEEGTVTYESLKRDMVSFEVAKNLTNVMQNNDIESGEEEMELN